MAAPARRAPRRSDPRRAPRRLSREARRELLIDAAMPLVAEDGIGRFSLDELAGRVDVTRNLLYHYFPRGRQDILVAAAQRAGRELIDGWVTDESLPIEQRMAANVQHVLEHVREPSDAWRIYRLARGSHDLELNSVFDGFQEVLIGAVSQNHLGTRRPPPLARMTIKAFLAFAETLLDEAREARVPPETALRILAESGLATGVAVRSLLAVGSAEAG